MADSIAVVQPESQLDVELGESGLSVIVSTPTLKVSLGGSIVVGLLRQEQTAVLESVLGGGSTATLTTSDNSFHTIQTIAISEGHVYDIDVTILGRETSDSDRAKFHLNGCFHNIGGSLVQENESVSFATMKSQSGWAVQLLINGTNVEVQVNSNSDTVNWKAEKEVIYV